MFTNLIRYSPSLLLANISRSCLYLRFYINFSNYYDNYLLTAIIYLYPFKILMFNYLYGFNYILFLLKFYILFINLLFIIFNFNHLI